MEGYKINGKEILASMVGITTDSKGNNIIEWENYIVLIKKNETELIIVLEKHYILSLRKAMAMVYIESGFDYIIEIIENNNTLASDEKDTIINDIINVFIDSEDYELAEKIKLEHQNYINETL